jgi:hypothetical protein
MSSSIGSDRSFDAKRVGRDFTFVSQEIVRHAELGLEVTKHLEGLDLLCSVRDPDGRMLLMGRAAYERLRTLAEVALENSDHHRRVSPNKAFQAVLDGFGRTYLSKDYSGSTDDADLTNIKGWIDETAATYVTLTHVIPCHIGLPMGESFVLGPVTISAGKEAVAANEARLKGWAADAGAPAGSDDAKRWQRDIDNTLSYLSGFQDIASVTIENCDRDTSEAAAKEAVQAAVNYIHIMAGAAHTRRMRVGGPELRGDRRARLAWKTDGSPILGWSRRWEGANIDKDFWAWLVSDEQRSITEAAGAAVQTIVERRRPELVAARYLDAASWYADAAREERPPAAIIKYLTAMERLLWTGEKSFGVTSRLAERAAALCFTLDTWNFHEIEDEVKAAYNLRSGIVHGRLGADDPIILENYRICERVAQDLLIIWLKRFGEGMNAPTTVELAKEHFDWFVAEVRSDLQRRSSNDAGSKPDV